MAERAGRSNKERVRAKWPKASAQQYRPSGLFAITLNDDRFSDVSDMCESEALAWKSAASRLPTKGK